MEIRLQKYLATAGVASRRAAEEMIAAGQVIVNGKAAEAGRKVDTEKDVVFVNGKEIKLQEEKAYFMLHKPEGYITTAKDQFERPSVLDLVQEPDYRLFPVGRLDYDTSGLLLLTNDGDLTYKLTHPKHKVEKCYVARVTGRPSSEALRHFREGIDLDGYHTAPAQIEIMKTQGKHTSLKIVIVEGKNRQVRKMCEAIGYPVASLKRVATGKLFLGRLPKGEYRRLTNKEIAYLQSL